VPDLVQWMYWLNPMASIIAELHTVLYHGSVPDPLFMARTLVTALVLLLIGYALFSRVNKHIGEHL
jgi:ABC-type polysaccharide/polyol phosphate export permease